MYPIDCLGRLVLIVGTEALTSTATDITGASLRLREYQLVDSKSQRFHQQPEQLCQDLTVALTNWRVNGAQSLPFLLPWLIKMYGAAHFQPPTLRQPGSR